MGRTDAAAAIATLDRTGLGLTTGPGVRLMRLEPQTQTGPHDHLFHEIVYVEAGGADHLTVEGARRLRPGDVIVIRPQVWHAYHRPAGLTIINCLAAPRLIQRLGPLLEKVEGAFELFRRRSPRPRLDPPVVLHAGPAPRQVILRRLQTMLAEQDRQAPGWEAALTAGLLELLVLCARLAGPGEREAAPPLPDRTEQAVLDAVSHLETHYQQAIDLAALARRVHLSPSHLSRSFSRRMGMGVVQFLHRMRAEEACRLLQTTRLSVGQVAAAVGYAEAAYFARCFRRQMGLSPRQYRRGGRSGPGLS